MFRRSPDFARLSIVQRIALGLAVGSTAAAAAGCTGSSKSGDQNAEPSAANQTAMLHFDCSKPLTFISDSVAKQVSDAWENGQHEKPDPSLLQKFDPTDFATLRAIGDFSFMQLVFFDGSQNAAPTINEQSEAYDLGTSLGITEIHNSGSTGLETGQGAAQQPVAAHEIAILPNKYALARLCDGAQVY